MDTKKIITGHIVTESDITKEEKTALLNTIMESDETKLDTFISKSGITEDVENIIKAFEDSESDKILEFLSK